MSWRQDRARYSRLCRSMRRSGRRSPALPKHERGDRTGHEHLNPRRQPITRHRRVRAPARSWWGIRSRRPLRRSRWHRCGDKPRVRYACRGARDLLRLRVLLLPASARTPRSRRSTPPFRRRRRSVTPRRSGRLRSLPAATTSTRCRRTIDPWVFESGVTGLIAQLIPRANLSNNFAGPATGCVGCVLIPVVAGMVVTSVSWLSATTALSAQTNWWFAFLDSSLKVIRQSTDQLNGGTWAANSLKTLTVDSVPVTAGARVASTTATSRSSGCRRCPRCLRPATRSWSRTPTSPPTTERSRSRLSVRQRSTYGAREVRPRTRWRRQVPTVQMAAGKRTYTVPANGYVVACYMLKAATVPTMAVFPASPVLIGVTPVIAFVGNSSLTGTCPSPAAMSGR